MLELGGFSLRALACCHAYRPDHWKSQFYPSIQDSRQHPQILSPGQAQEEFPPRHSGTCLSKHQALPLGLPSALHTYSSTRPVPTAFPEKKCLHTCAQLSLHLEHRLIFLVQIPPSCCFKSPSMDLTPSMTPTVWTPGSLQPPSLMILLPCGVFLPAPPRPPPQEGWSSCRSRAMVTTCLCAQDSSRSLGVFQRRAWHRRSVLLWAASPLPGPSRVVCFRVAILMKKEPLYY